MSLWHRMKPLSNRSYLSLLTVGDQTWDPSICNSMWPLSRLVLLTTSGSIQSICTVQERRILHPDELLALPSGHEWFCQKVYCNSYGPGRSTLRSLNGLASHMTLILLKTVYSAKGWNRNFGRVSNTYFLHCNLFIAHTGCRSNETLNWWFLVLSVYAEAG